MAQAQGSSSKTYIGIERDAQAGTGTWGLGTIIAAHKGFYIPFKTNTLRKSVDLISSQQITSTRQPSAGARGNVDIAGDLTAELEGKAHGMLWYLTLGARAVKTVSRIAFTSGAIADPIVGEVISTDVGATTATVVGFNITSGTIAGTDAAGYVYVHTIAGGTFDNTDALVGATSGFTGTQSGAITATHSYQHEFWIYSSMPSAVIERQLSDIDLHFLYSGCIANTMSLNITSSGFAEYSVGFMGKNESTVSATEYFTGGLAVDVSGTTFDNFQVTIGEGPGGVFSNVANLTEFSLEFNNNLDGSAVAIGGSGVRAGIAAGLPSATGRFKGIFENATLYNKALAKTETGFRVTLANAASPTGENGTERLRITLPEVYISPAAPPIDGPGGVYQDMTFTAFYSNETTTGRTTAFHVELWNQVIDYVDGA